MKRFIMWRGPDFVLPRGGATPQAGRFDPNGVNQKDFVRVSADVEFDHQQGE